MPNARPSPLSQGSQGAARPDRWQYGSVAARPRSLLMPALAVALLVCATLIVARADASPPRSWYGINASGLYQAHLTNGDGINGGSPRTMASVGLGSIRRG